MKYIVVSGGKTTEGQENVGEMKVFNTLGAAQNYVYTKLAGYAASTGLADGFATIITNQATQVQANYLGDIQGNLATDTSASTSK